MAEIKHSGGLVEAILELGFDRVKYFEGTISGTATGFTIDPPARRLQVTNMDDTANVFLRINDSPATTATSLVPGDDIKIIAGSTFTMDFDSLSEVSFISDAEADIEGLLGWKGTM